MPVSSGPPPADLCATRRTHDYVRYGTTTLFAAFNIADGTVIGQTQRRHRSAEFKRFLTRVVKTVPAGLDIHVVIDNYAAHKTPEIKAWRDCPGFS
jgi:hypothetical protein